MKSLIISGTTRFYDEEGTGPPVIPVHGSMSSARQWRTLSEVLRGRHRLLMPDLLATGAGADSPAGAFNFAEDVALTAALIDLAGEPVHLIGHSYGGVVAIKAAFARRTRLASLTLIEPSCFHLLAQESETEYAEILDAQAAQQAALKRGDRDGSAEGFIAYWMGPQAWAAMPERRRAAMVEGLPKLAEDWRGTLNNETTLDDYRGFTVPTLLLRAKDTRRPSFRIVDLLRAALAAAAVVEIDGGGHMSPLTNPGPVNAAIARFIADRQNQAGSSPPHPGEGANGSAQGAARW